MLNQFKNQISSWMLMHKNEPVLTMDVLDRNATILDITSVFNVSHAPLGTVNENKEIDITKLETWFGKRAIPASRAHIEDFLSQQNIPNTRSLSFKGFGLNLSDQYWVKLEKTSLRWSQVNFFENEFSETFGEVLTSAGNSKNESIDFLSPDTSVDGWLEKKWVISNGTRGLLKGWNPLYKQEPYNEKIATDIMNLLNIPHIPYEITVVKNKVYSWCETFVDAKTELIPAVDIVKHTPQIEGDTRLTHLLRGCDILGMDVYEVKLALDKMIVIDFLIGNYDRHWRNFGFIRNAETLEWLGFAPIFDSGASLWQFHDEISMDNVKSMTFKTTLVEQLELLTDLSWYEKIDDEVLFNIVKRTLEKHPSMQEERLVKIAEQVVKNSNIIHDLKKKLDRK